MGEIMTRTFARTHGVPAVIARLFCVYGPGERPERALVEVQRYLRWHLCRMPIEVVGDMDRKTRDYVHIRDVVAGLAVLADKGVPGELYNLGSGEEVSMRQLINVIRAVTEREPQIDAMPHMTEDTFRQLADISKLKALGFTPQMSLAEGVRELAAELGDYPELPSVPVVLKAAPLQAPGSAS
jgi:UDP-glucose 4-epimerase